MYHAGENAGRSEIWEHNWSDGQLDAAVRFAALDPLRPVFERHLAPGTHLLEGGCGRGQYVVHYSRRGVRVVGFDFARRTLCRLKATHPETILCAGDVASLPFSDGSFDAYFSGGVVEHFEAGPEDSLREARRVLRPGGILLVSVPYLSPFRRLSRVWRSDRRFVRHTTVNSPASGRSSAFWQYAFGVNEFKRLLVEAGFRVRATFPYALLFGLSDLPFVEKALNRRQTGDGMRGAATTATAPPLVSEPLSLFKRILVSEDRTVPLAGPLLEVIGRACANMMLYVCESQAE